MRKLKVGQIFWECHIFDGKVDWNEWVLRSIQNRSISKYVKTKVRTAYFVLKEDGVTWVKKSKKHFDYGWAANIPEEYRKSQHLDCGDCLPIGIYTSRLQAAKGCIACEERYLAYWLKQKEEELIEHCEINLTRAKANLTRERNKCKK